MRLPPISALILLVGWISGCSTTEVVSANSTPAIQATSYEPDRIMDIGIQPLDPGVPESEEELDTGLIVPDVRLAESRFIAYHLKDTLEKTGNWGAVRVTPDASSAVDLNVTGRIVGSDGESLKVRIKAADASGRVWLDKTYDDAASKFSYQLPQEDAFQDFYNEVANDLLAFRKSLSADQISEVRAIASLQYAESLSPDAFSGYLAKNGSRVVIRQLPAEGDGMMARIDRIKDREYLFIDTLDDFYGKFYREMQAPYNEWRFYTYDEAIKLRRIKREARNRLLGGAALIAGGLYAGQESGTYAGQAGSVSSVLGGVSMVKSGLNRRKEAEMHATSLKELSDSLGAEITPIVLEVEGRSVELKGTVETQYDQWRQILKDIYAEETGLPVR